MFERKNNASSKGIKGIRQNLTNADPYKRTMRFSNFFFSGELKKKLVYNVDG